MNQSLDDGRLESVDDKRQADICEHGAYDRVSHAFCRGESVDGDDALVGASKEASR